jgi:hypothetical protein
VIPKLESKTIHTHTHIHTHIFTYLNSVPHSTVGLPSSKVKGRRPEDFLKTTTTIFTTTGSCVCVCVSVGERGEVVARVRRRARRLQM